MATTLHGFDISCKKKVFTNTELDMLVKNIRILLNTLSGDANLKIKATMDRYISALLRELRTTGWFGVNWMNRYKAVLQRAKELKSEMS